MTAPNCSDLFNLKDKVACVTGASSGLGRRAADVLVASGARVVGVARRADVLQEWTRQHNGMGAPIVADLADRSAISDIARRVKEPYGPPEILINAAGVNMRETADTLTSENWDVTLDLNLAVPFFLAQALVGEMRARQRGRIVNFASLQSFRAFPAGLAYGAAKGGIVQLTRAMAEAWSSDGVTANALGPGFFHTELTKAVFSDSQRAARNAAQTCIGRNGDLADIDGPLLFLCSEASRYVTGQILMVDGGFTAK